MSAESHHESEAPAPVTVLVCGYAGCALFVPIAEAADPECVNVVGWFCEHDAERDEFAIFCPRHYPAGIDASAEAANRALESYRAGPACRSVGSLLKAAYDRSAN